MTAKMPKCKNGKLSGKNGILYARMTTYSVLKTSYSGVLVEAFSLL